MICVAVYYPFPHANIHNLLSPDILHQLIKSTFKDHLITWVNNYIRATNSDKIAKKILNDINLQ